MKVVRVCLCQLESHPAIYSGDVDYLEEPYVPPTPKMSLSWLSRQGLDVGTMQERVRDAYLAWSAARLRAIVSFLESIDPIPDVLLFPEGAVPIESLSLLQSWSSTSGCTILGGTHTPLNTPVAARCYAALGIDAKRRKRELQGVSTSVLPLVRKGRFSFLPKTVMSPFEKTEVAEDSDVRPIHRVYPIHTRSQRLQLLPLVCIEALRYPEIKGRYDLVGILSYDRKPSRFQSFIDQQVQIRKPVLYCNDGRFGGTRVGAVRDARTPSWLNDTFPDGLPPGDSLLVVDIDLSVTTIQVGTSDPQTSTQLVALASIVGEESSTHEAARGFAEAERQSEGLARATCLAELMNRQALTGLQRERIRYLEERERRGVSSSKWWTALGTDCVIPGHGGLGELEGSLAVACCEDFGNLLVSAPMNTQDGASVFVEFFRECKKRSTDSRALATQQVRSEVQSVVDREDETAATVAFIDNRSSTVLEMSGLPGIGKSCILEKALSQSGVGGVHRMRLTDTSSADYIVSELLRRRVRSPEPPYEDVKAVLNGRAFGRALDGLRVLVFERAHLLVGSGGWRDSDLDATIECIIERATELSFKVIFETQRELPLDLHDPALRQRLRVKGLQKSQGRFGRAIFDAQLRRVGLTPDVVSEDEKEEIIEKLGGHPVAIALAADACYGEGGPTVVRDLRSRKGVFWGYLRRLVRMLALDERDEIILRSLTLARMAVPRGVVLASVGFAAGSVLRNLIALGAVEVREDGNVEIAGVLREYFDASELAPEIREGFHKAAAKAFAEIANGRPPRLDAAIEAEFHSGVVGLRSPVDSRLLDGALATAKEQFRTGHYRAAGRVLEMLLTKRRTPEIVGLAARVAARCNEDSKAVGYAREVLVANPRDTRLLADLGKIALTQHQDDTLAKKVLTLARDVGIEDVNILVFESRMLLRRNQLHDAEAVLVRARQITRFSAWPYYYLGNTYYRMGRLEDAITVLEDGRDFFYETNGRSRRALNAIRTQLAIAYLFADEVDAAARILDPLIEEDPGPEAARAYAALTIKRDGIQQAEKAFKRLREASIRNRFERCQFHLFYGLFQLAIENRQEALEQFSRAHSADRSNVYVMIRWAKALYDVADEHYLAGNEVYEAHVADCGTLVDKILSFDADNEEGVRLMNALYQRFEWKIGEGGEVG